jgi:type I restriction enzyme S subunit
MNTIRLGDLVSITGGGTPDRSNPAFWGGDIPWATVKDFKTLEISSTTEHITEEGLKGSAANVAAVGSIIIPTRMALGKAAINTVPVAINQDLKALRVVDPEVVDRDYLFRFLLSQSTYLESQGQGATVKGITLSVLRDLDVPVPPLREQQRIATILDQADSLHRKRQEAIRLADEFLRSVFIDMFGGLDNASNPQVELADVVTLDAPMVEPTSDEFADLLHVGPDRIEKGNGQLLACETARAEGLTSKKFLFDERYVLYSKIRPALKKCALAEFRGLCSADMYPVRPLGSEVTREFIWGMLLSDAFDRYISTLPDRANIPKLNRVELNAFQFRLPSIDLQRKYSSIVQRTMALKRQHNTFLKQAVTLPAALGFFN